MKILELIKADFRNVFRDPTLLAAAVAPILITSVVVLLPLLNAYIMGRWQVDISPYYHITTIFFSIIIAMVYGIISAFIILDEKDEAILSFVKITPFSISGYLKYRAGFALLSTFLALLFYFSVVVLLGRISVFEALFLTLVIPFEAVWLSLVVTCFSSNKVEGLAIAKMVGLIPFTAVGTWFVKGGKAWLLSLFPPFWIVKTIEAETVMSVTLFALGCFLVHVLYIVLQLQRFKKKILD